jgi:hypothetical protein
LASALGVNTVNIPNDYINNIVSTFDYATVFFNKNNDPEFFCNFIDSVLHRLKFNLFQLPTEFLVSEVFECLNNRGRPLSKLELLKNRLLHISYLNQLESNLLSRINNTWQTVYDNLYQLPNTKIDDEVFLRTHWFVHFNTKEYKDPWNVNYSDDLFRHRFKPNSEYSVEKLGNFLFSLELVSECFSICRSGKNSASSNFSQRILNQLRLLNLLTELVVGSSNYYLDSLTIVSLCLLKEDKVPEDMVFKFLCALEGYTLKTFGLSKNNQNKNKLVSCSLNQTNQAKTRFQL